MLNTNKQKEITMQEYKQVVKATLKRIHRYRDKFQGQKFTQETVQGLEQAILNRHPLTSMKRAANGYIIKIIAQDLHQLSGVLDYDIALKLFVDNKI